MPPGFSTYFAFQSFDFEHTLDDYFVCHKLYIFGFLTTCITALIQYISAAGLFDLVVKCFGTDMVYMILL